MSDEGRLLLSIEGESRPPAELPRAGVLVIGSSKERAGFLVEGAGVEGLHCAIGRAKGGGWALKDMGSAQGTHVNGRKIDAVKLAAGDTIAIGARLLRVIHPRLVDSSGSAAPQRADAAERASDTDVIELESSLEAALHPMHLGNLENLGNAGGAGAAPKPEIALETARAGASPRIQGYRIERLLGRGGMGEVYLAVQASLDRQVALKVLAARFEADREFVRRFQAEARAAAALNHPNVVTVYDVGEDRGTHYLSMEYMDRGNLEERVAQIAKSGVRIPAREVLDILRDAATGLIYAEARGIVHRDLKPANLMQNHVGTTKIADLGLATHVETEESQSADKKIFGTPHFMSPEQARGEKVDHRSDLYSLGATAYRLLTGHTPFEGTSSREILRAHLRDEPRPMREFAPELSVEVVALVSRLMQKDPAARFPSAEALVREIERLLAGGATGAARAPGAAPAAPGRRASRSTSPAIAGALIAIAAGGWYVWQQRQSALPSEVQLGGQPGPASIESVDAARSAAQTRAKNALPTPNGEPTDEAPDGAQAADRTATADTRPPAVRSDPEDKSLQLLEANARVAYLELLTKEMDPNDRRDELRALSAKYRGTTAAAEAVQKADEIQARIQEALLAQAQQHSALDGILLRLRTAAALDARPPHPGEALLSMRAVEGQAAWLSDPAFVAARKNLEREVMQAAADYANAVLEQSGRASDAGKFDEARALLADLMPVFDLPDFPPGEGPAGVTELFATGRIARERSKNLELAKGAYVSKQVREDVKAIAAGLGGPAGLERELRELDLPAARERLARMQPRLTSPDGQTFIQELSLDLAQGEEVLVTLAREFTKSGWRRRGFTDPRDKRGVTRNAVGADAGGILSEGEGGAVEHIPWSVFGGSARELSKLFFERCTRDYTESESRAIAGLVRIAAVTEAIDIASKMFEPSRKVNFTEANAREMVECFAPVQSWAARSSSGPAITREIEAAQILANVLLRTTEGAWSAAVAGTERLLDEYQATLLVRLLSDGNPAPRAAGAPLAPAVEAAPVAPIPAAGPGAPPGQPAGPEQPKPPKEGGHR